MNTRSEDENLVFEDIKEEYEHKIKKMVQEGQGIIQNLTNEVSESKLNLASMELRLGEQLKESDELINGVEIKARESQTELHIESRMEIIKLKEDYEKRINHLQQSYEKITMESEAKSKQVRGK